MKQIINLRALVCLVTLGFLAAAFSTPFVLRTSASKGLVPSTESHADGLPNYDIRTDKSAWEKVAGFRLNANVQAAAVADIREEFLVGESALKMKVPTLKVDYNQDIRTPEVIGPDVMAGRAFLTGSTNGKRSDVLQRFIAENERLIGVTTEQALRLKVFADYTNPDGNLGFVELNQEINGIPVFRGEVKAGFTKRGEMIRVVNNLAPGIDDANVSSDFGDPVSAVNSAAKLIGSDATKLDMRFDEARSSGLKVVFGVGDAATTAEKMYFPTEPGVAVPAWRVLIWQPVNAYYIIVDANTGTMLWRKNITEDQTQSATYSVYTNPNAMVNVADNPFPMTPGPISPNGTQGAAIARTSVTRIGNEAPYTFNNLGWITDGGNVTDGNAVQAGLDRDGVNGVDANSEALGSSRNFTYTYNPFNPNTGTGDAPVAVPQTYPGSQYQQGSVTQLFYICNWYHDELYRLGFTEQARNFQNSNFGRGGVEADRVSAEGQDSSGTNNANFSTPADGGRGRMQMYIWTGPNPDIDGNVDADVVVHEHTHGLSNRLHGNGSGLSINMSRGMGEGWSDFYGHALLSEPTDPINGIYTTGGYDTYLGSAGFVNNYYYGIRRFPKAVRAFTGGPGNLPHNPLTFADTDSTQFNISDGAYGRGPFGSSTVDAVHNLGEIWSSALWEVRANMITRLGWATGNRKVLQLVTDGMKLAPLAPTFLTERDAILAAAQASSLAPEAAADVADVWAGFATRGMGFGASIQNTGTGTGNTRVTEAFDLPNLFQAPTLTVSDTDGNNNGYADPGENLTLNIPISNSTGNTATGVTLQVVGGGSANYGTIISGATVTQGATFTVPVATACGSVVTLTLNINSSLGPVSVTRTLAVGQPVVTFTENFDAVTAPAIPAGWAATVVQSGINFVTTTTTPDTGANAAFALNPTTVGGGTDLTSPAFPVTVAGAIATFRHKYDTEAGWDGGLLEISVAGGAFQDILAAGGVFVQNGYTGALGAGANNPLSNRASWNGNSGGYITTIVRMPAAAAGQNVQLRWRFGADDNTAGTGWWVDSVEIAGNAQCVSIDNFAKTRVDFDGDHKTDISVFRPNGPSGGEWWFNKSSNGTVGAATFGNSTDKPTPVDFTGDGKTDIAFFRPGTGEWFVLRSEDQTFYAFAFGNSTDIPTPDDFDGDGKADAAVFRPSTATWYISKSTGGTTIQQFGIATDLPAAADYDGDGKADIAIYRPTGANGSEWWIQRSSLGLFATQFGASGDKAVPADYTGDGKADVAFWKPSTGQWYVLRSENLTYFAFAFGSSTDLPTPGDYDGDGKTDAAVFRPSNATWYVNKTTGGTTIQQFGVATDIPAPNVFVR